MARPRGARRVPDSQRRSPDESVTPTLPEGTRAEFTAGFGTRLGSKLTADLAYQYIDQADRRGRRSHPIPPTTACSRSTRICSVPRSPRRSDPGDTAMSSFKRSRLSCWRCPSSPACYSDDSLNPSETPPVPAVGADVPPLCAMGNSISAGFQSAGINDSTQGAPSPSCSPPRPAPLHLSPPEHAGLPVALRQQRHQDPRRWHSRCAVSLDLLRRLSNTGAINNVAVPGKGVETCSATSPRPVSIYEQL